MAGLENKPKMAQRRMFSKQVTNSSEFLMMSQSAQNLYFHLGMNADDDGFCEVFTIMRMTESKPDDLQALHNRALIYVADNKVCIVKDWHENNLIRLDRYKQSVYLSDPKYAELYKVVMEDKLKKLDIYKKLLDGKPVGNQRLTQVRLGKDSKGKDTETMRGFEDFWKSYPRKTAKTVAEKSFSKLKVDPVLLDKMLIALDIQKSSSQWTRDSGSYIPHPSTWLNQRRWEDEIKPEIIKGVIDLN